MVRRKVPESFKQAVKQYKQQSETASAVASLAGRIAESARTAAEQTQNRNILPLPILNSKALNSLPVTPKKAIQSAQTAARSNTLRQIENTGSTRRSAAGQSALFGAQAAQNRVGSYSGLEKANRIKTGEKAVTYAGNRRYADVLLENVSQKQDDVSVKRNTWMKLQQAANETGDPETGRLAALAKSNYESAQTAATEANEKYNEQVTLETNRKTGEKLRETNRLRARPDFQSKAAAGAKKAESRIARYDRVAPLLENRMKREEIEADNDTRYYYKFLDDDQREMYHYLLETEGTKEADAYLDLLRPELDRLEAEERQRADEEFYKNNRAGAVIDAIISQPMKAVAAIDLAGDIFKRKATGEHTPVNLNSRAWSGVVQSGQAHEAALEGTSGIGRFLAETGLSIAENAARLPLGPGAGLAVMGLSVTSDTAYEALQKGATPEQAFALGMEAGIIEYLTEKMPTENLFQLIRHGAPDRSVIKEVLRQAGMEASEEIVSEIAGTLNEIRIMGDKSDFMQYQKELMDGGMSKSRAQQQAIEQFFIKNVAKAGAGGALSGLALSGAVQAPQILQNRQTGTNRLQAANPVQINENAASNDATESTVINTNPAVHTAAEQKTIEKYQKSVDNQLLNWINKVKNAFRSGDMTASKMRKIVGEVTEDAASAIKKATDIDVSGYKHMIDGSAIRHIDLRHGENGEADNSMQNAQDIARVKFILDDFDTCNLVKDERGRTKTSATFRNSDNTPAPLLRLSKKINGTYYVVEAAPDSKDQKLHIISTYMKKDSGSINQELNMSLNDPQPTSKTPLDPIASAVDTTVPQNGYAVNTQRVHSNSIDTDRANDTQRAHSTRRARSTQDAAESTVINTNPAVHTAAEQKTIEEYQSAVDDDLVRFIENSMANRGSNNGRYPLHPVSERAAEDIKKLTGVDTTGFQTVLEQRIAEHIVNRHGEKGEADQSMQDINDIARMQYVIDNYDFMELSGKSRAYTTNKENGKPGQADTVRYVKKVNGTYYVVEAIPNTKAKTTFVVSAYMARNNEAGNQLPVLAKTPDATSENAGAEIPASIDTTVPQNGYGVNTQRVYSNSIDTDRANDTQRARSTQRAHSTQEGAQNNEAVFNGSGERDAGLDTGRQTGRMAEGAGRNTGGKTQREYATERENRYAASSAQRQYVEALGQEADIYPEALYDEDLRRTADELREQGIEPVFFLGDITVTSGGKKLKSRGYYEDGRAYVKINNGVTARQIARHEAFHELAERDAGLVSRLAEQIVQRGGERELKQFVAAYTQAYQGCYGDNENAYIEEICADAYAGVNGFSYADTVTEQAQNASLEGAQAVRNTVQNENAARTLHTEDEAGGRAMINPNFETEIDLWNGKSERTFLAGNTSEALKSIGVDDRNIIWHSAKISKILKKHKSMTKETIKQIPQILENPIVVLKSQNSDSRLAIFGEIRDQSGNPVTAILELMPTNRGGELLNLNIIASAYGKDSNLAKFITDSEILYLDENKKRTENWLQGLGLRLPSDTTVFGSMGSVTYQDGKVKIEGRKIKDWQTLDGSPVQYTPDGKIIYTSGENDMQGHTEMRRALEKAEQTKDGRSSVDVSEYLEKAGLDPKKLSRMTDEEIVGLPEKKPGSGKAGDSRSRFAESVEKQNYFGEQLREAARKDSSIQSYDRIANDETMRKAADALDDGGRGEIEAWFRKDAKQATAQDIAKGFLLMDRYQKAGDYDGMIAAAQKLREMGTAAGQTVQMFSIMGRMTPEGMLAYAQKTLDDAKERFLENKARAWVERNKGRFTLTEEETQKIVDNVKKAQKLPEGRDKKILLAEISSLIADKIPKNFGQKARTYVRTNLLLNPKTQLRNIQGNAIIAPMHAMSDFVGSGVDRMIAKKTGVRTTGSSTRGMLSGAKKGLYESFDDFRRGINTRNAEGDRFEIGEGNSFSNKSPIGKALNALDRVNSFLLDAGDRPFYEAWFIKSLNNQMRLNHVNKPTAEMISIATNDALRRTWQDANAWTKAASGVRRTLNLGRGYGPGDMIMPFVKTPMNLAKAIVDFSPAGLVKTLARDGRALTIAMQNGKATAQMQRDFVTNLSNGIVGTILVGTAYMLAANGYLSGAGDEDKDVRKFEENVLGIKPYSVKIGDKSYSYEWAQPVGGLLAIAADLEQTVDEGKITEYFRSGEGLATLLNQILSAGKSGISVLAEQSFLQSIQTLFGEDDLMTGLLEAAAEEPVKWLPASSLMNQIASFGDEAVRSSYDNQSPYVTTAVNKVKARIPGLRQTLPENVDVLGRTIENQNDFFNVFFNPANTAQAKPTEASNEMYRLYKATGDKSLLPHAADYSLTYQETKYILDGEERAEYQRVMGKTAHEGVADLLESRSYRNMTDEKKAAAIKLVYEYASAQAKAEYLEEQGVNYETDGFAEKMQELSKYGVKAGEFAPIYLTQNECEGEHAGYQKANVVINSTLARRKQNAILNMQMSDSQKRRFQEAAIRFGMDERRFMAIYWKLQTIQSDRDQNGKPANNAKEKRIRWLRENGYSNAEAWAVYEIMCANG